MTTPNTLLEAAGMGAAEVAMASAAGVAERLVAIAFAAVANSAEASAADVAGAAEAAGTPVGAAVAEVGSVAGALEPPPQATSVAPNTAAAAIRDAKFWSGSVMAVLRELQSGINYCPVEFPKVTPKQNPVTAKSKLLFHIRSKYNERLSIFLRILFV
ncbi:MULTISPECIES: hypothetical protein [unclassified Massilia]|uniref:hypothetical protein n=1 Tax=unclassified Massilia TaxID=2609279 RepID=UPI00177F866A|nr:MULTISPECIES: hypothetical protein [unclassified Massilia]MBD8531368.1 hypothetical protein [Massilia sp. CFBP 13647]MBD8674378.1 hypothetical protein [Massilia sp. CFBP 13721]